MQTKTRTKKIVSIALITLASGSVILGLTFISINKKTGQTLNENLSANVSSKVKAASQNDKLHSYMGSPTASRPSEAFNSNAINGATLSGLQWKQTKERVEKVVGNVLIREGSFSSGFYTGPVKNADPNKTTFDHKTVLTKSKAILYQPQSPSKAVPLLVFARHEESLLSQNEDQIKKMVDGLQIAILVHAESESDWSAFSMDGRGDMTKLGIKDLIRRNACSKVDVLTSNYGYLLARTNMLAITLGKDLLAKNRITVGNIGLMGASKEGYAVWIASAVDRRITYAVPERFARELYPADGRSFYEKNSGCSQNGGRYNNVDTYEEMIMTDWLAKTPAGQSFRGVLEVSAFAKDMLPKAMLIVGDAGMYNMHDGKNFTMGQETAFLDSFNSVPHRHDLSSGLAGDLSGDAGNITGNADARILLNLGHMLATVAPKNLPSSGWVKITSAKVIDNGRTITFEVQVEPDPDLKEVAIFWNQSPNREFNDEAQSPWKKIILNKVSRTTNLYRSNPITPTARHEVAWYASVQEVLNIGRGYTMPRRDASHIRTLRDLPPQTCNKWTPLRCGA